MKAVVGVDLARLYQPAMNLLRRLEIPDVSLHAVHSVESVLPDGGFGPSGGSDPIAEITAQRVEAGHALLHEAESLYPGMTLELEHGDPAWVIEQSAKRVQADLVVVGSERKGFFGSLFFGSVAKGLLMHCPQSLLVGRGEVAPEGRLKVVIATDHSDYADKCLELLLKIAPRGLGSIHLVAVVPAEIPLWTPENAAILPDLTEAMEQWESEWVQRNQLWAGRLESLGAFVTHEVRRGKPNDVIPEVVQGQKAELLILGAQGHGFLERLRLGSVSFHQLVNEPSSVWILRV